MPRKNLSPEEKQKIIAECAAPDANVAEICKQYGVARSSLSNWRKGIGLGRSGIKVTSPVKKSPQLMELQIPMEDDADTVQMVMINGSAKHVESVMKSVAAIFRR